LRDFVAYRRCCSGWPYAHKTSEIKATPPQTLSLVGLTQPTAFYRVQSRAGMQGSSWRHSPKAIAHRLPHDAALRYLCTTPLTTEQLLLAYFLLSWIARRLVYKALPLGVFLLFFYPSALCILFSFDLPFDFNPQ